MLWIKNFEIPIDCKWQPVVWFFLGGITSAFQILRHARHFSQNNCKGDWFVSPVLIARLGELIRNGQVQNGDLNFWKHWPLNSDQIVRHLWLVPVWYYQRSADPGVSGSYSRNSGGRLFFLTRNASSIIITPGREKGSHQCWCPRDR